MARVFSLLFALTLLAGCATQPTVKSGVDLEQLIKGKSQAIADSHEAIPNTYFELTAWTGDDAKNPPTAPSATGTLGSASQVACAAATERSGAENGGRCEITIAGSKFKLKARDSVVLNGSGEVTLSCAGDAPARCKALVVN
jgi:hypothetical protein